MTPGLSRAQAAASTIGILAVIEAVSAFCGVTVWPAKSMPVFSVVVVIPPAICRSVAARAWRTSPSARRMPAAATATVGFFSWACAIASAKVTRTIEA